MSENQELVAALDVLARAWREGDWSALAAVLHREVVFRAPGGLQAIQGRDPCLSSYVAFMDQAEVLDFEAGEPVIDLLGDLAMVIQPWSIRYRMGEEVHDEDGSDLYAFRREEGRWQLVWRGATGS
ncbi:MAG: nuclear transport factor 2 family protein [Planctomycetes bacterium]|nr:nuclear transport factor 2 family protein [Planctomycetota bacterium]